MKKILLIVCLITITILPQTARFVSKTGNSTPPYISWETAHDSIRPVIDICNPGDTIFIDSGIYDDTLDINIPLTFIGKGIDETTIDGINDRVNSIYVNAKTKFEGINFIGGYKHLLNSSHIIYLSTKDTLIVNNCRFNLAASLIFNRKGITSIKNSFFNVESNCAGISTISRLDSVINDVIEDNVFYSAENGIGLVLSTKNLLCKNNHFFGEFIYFIDGACNNITIENNYFASTKGTISFDRLYDTLIIRNNIIANQRRTWGIGIFVYQVNKAFIYNNVFLKNYFAVGIRFFNEYYTDYNCYYKNVDDLTYNSKYGPNDIFENPMFEEEFNYLTSPDELNARLLKYSPLIDAGKPDVFDVDGTRSDIGLYGGPNGISYEHKDLAPEIPQGFDGEKLNNSFRLFWDANDEYDLKNYKLYSFSDSNCVIQTGVFNIAKTETSYQDNIPQETRFFKLTAIDSTNNESAFSNRVIVYNNGIVDVTEVIKPYEYKLYQNYPNPFNPETTIKFALPADSFVEISLYNTLGQKIKTISKGHYSAGYQSVSFNGSDLASGMYIYRIKAVGENGKEFVDSKKMILMK